MTGSSDKLIDEISKYYTGKLVQYGKTPKGVDWKDENSQLLRFSQLCKLLPETGKYSITDVGCGYGALLDYLLAKGDCPTYLGVDVSAQMISEARNNYPASEHCRFIVAEQADCIQDYCVASGIFNVRLHFSDLQWREYLEVALGALYSHSNLGFAFNCLTVYSDEAKKRGDLYYADPLAIFDLCKKRFSRHVSLLHDYGLYEFTIIVRKVL